ncbi:MAG: folate-binding protein YgfZ [Pseudomonadota bacterium]|nr:folate-binding protein YgfZ [Pseudomonadota bacterium]
MGNTWQLQLETFGATVTDREAQHFGDPAAELMAAVNATVLADLSHLGLIEVSGPDALPFLQGQLTQDVAKITDERAAYAGHCSPKGRLLAHFLAWKSNESYFLQLPQPLVESIQKRLKMYVMRSKVEVADVSRSSIRFGLGGADAATLIASLFGNAPLQSMDIVRTPMATIIALSNGRFQILVAEEVLNIWRKLAQQAEPVGAPVWRWLQIQAGIPEIYPATQEQFVPQMVNSDLIGAVSFQKGCYTGQEIVARLHYLGKAKRRMVGAHLDIAETPQPGEAIYGDRLPGQAIGMLVDSAPAPQGGWDLLVSVPIEEKGESVHYFKSPDGPKIQVDSFTISEIS